VIDGSAPTPQTGPEGTFDTRMASNAVWLLVAQISALAAGLVVVVTITRVLGAGDLGRWRFAQAVTALLLVLSDAGLTALAIREIARHPDEVARYGRPVMRVRLVIATGLLIALAILLVLASPDPASAQITLLVALGLLPAALSATYLFQGREAMGPVSRLRTASLIVAAIAAIIGTIVVGTLVAAVVPFLLASIGVAAVTMMWAGRAGYLESDTSPRISPWSLIVPAAPFLLAALAVQVIFNADAFIIRAFRGEEELGLYAAPYSIAGYSLILGGAVMSAAYPRIASLEHLDPHAAVAALVDDLSAVMGVLAVPASVGVILVADLLVVALFGPAFIESGPILAVLMTLPLLGFLNMTLGQALTARGLPGPVAGVAVVAATLNVLLNLFLVPRLGGIGAAISVAITELVTIVLYVRVNWRRGAAAPVRHYFDCLPATLVMAAVVAFGRVVVGLPLALLVALGIVSFLLGSLVFPSRGLAILRQIAPGVRR